MSAAGHTQALPRAVHRRQSFLLTPEGVPVKIELAEPGERLIAFVIDFVITLAATLVVDIGALLSWGSLATPALLFVAFVIRNGYFIFFELRWAGSTPGKKALGLRVIRRRGGALGAGAVVARNLTRQAEFFFPIELLLITQNWGWAWREVLPTALWLLALGVLMVKSRDRVRPGDLIAGTIVISIPKRILLEDLATERQQFVFIDKHLQMYGVLELQVLEDVLRRPAHLLETQRLKQDIRERIQKRIGWEGPNSEADPTAFLQDFYGAQRAFLERRKHLGEERADKFYKDSEGNR